MKSLFKALAAAMALVLVARPVTAQSALSRVAIVAGTAFNAEISNKSKTLIPSLS